MNNIAAQQKASTSQAAALVGCLFEVCHRFDLTPIPLKPKSKIPLVRWSGNSWKPTPIELETWASKPDINWGVRCGQNLAVIDCDSEDAYRKFVAIHCLPSGCPVVKTGRGYHIWVRPKTPIRSQRVDGIEIKCLGSYVVAPPSIHPSGAPYIFQVPPNGALPEVDLEALLKLPSGGTVVSDRNPANLNAPSDFALRYGKSPYPQALCGLATKIITSPDGQVKKLLGLRCWKWHCPKCAPLLERHWLKKMENVPFRFILKLPTMAKPITFARRVGKPEYVHIVANGESWLFLGDGNAEKVWSEARRAGYQLVAGDITGDPTPQELRDCLHRALCHEREPLNTRRKISHSRGLFRKQPEDSNGNESKQAADCSKGGDHMNKDGNNESHTWRTEVVGKPIELVAKQLQAEGWHILWKSEVEAIAVKGQTSTGEDIDIVELMGMLGVKLRRVGNEYRGLCPFHDDHIPSLSVNRGKAMWHCFGCGRGGTAQQFLKEWQTSQTLKEH